MKLTLLLTVLTLVNAAGSVYSQSKGLTLSLKNATLQEVFNKIEDQSKFKFFYQNEQIDVNRLVSVNVDGAKVEDVLDKLFANANVKYRVLEDNLVLLTADKLQQNKVTGTVVSAKDGQPLPGVSVQEKGTTNGAMTDVNGKFSINVQGSSSVLVFSFIGYLPEEKEVGSQSVLNVSLNEDIKQLEEVVVIGYGQTKKSLVTGAITSVKAKDIAFTNISRPEEALQGKTAGVQIVPQSGAPGAAMNIRIRGYGSNGNSSPIFIVDGTETGDINYLDPNDISTMEVLKDAASSAIYGSRGGNGVVIITTKQGQAGKVQVTYDFQHAFKSVGKLPKLMNTSQYAKFMTEHANGATPLISSGPVDTTYNTNWLNAIFENSHSTKHHLTFSGGNEKSRYLVALGYLYNDGIIVGKNDVFSRYTVRLNSDHKIASWVKIGNNLDYAHFTSRGINENSGEFGGMIGSALQLDPTTPVEYTDPTKIPSQIQSEIAAHQDLILKAPSGNYWGISQYVGGEIMNPFVTQALTNGVYTQDKLMGNIFAEFTPFKGFTFTSRLGLDLAFANNHFWSPMYYYNSIRQNTSAYPTDNNDYYNTWSWENFASYTRKFGQHNLTVLAGMSANDYYHKFINGVGSTMLAPNNDFAQLSYTTHAKDNVTGTYAETRMESYFGRLSYDYKSKYMFEGTLRRDGTSTSNVPVAGRWGVFPSVSGGWVVSNESFFPKTILSYAKARVSWGQNGSISSLGEGQYKYIASITTSASNGQPLNYPMSNGSFVGAAEPAVLNNPELTWETSEQIDYGVDLKALNDKLSFTVDYYKKTTKNLLFIGTPPAASGNFAGFSNGGNVENKGIEIEVGYRDKVGDFNYAVNFNVSTLKNKVTYLSPVFGNRQPGANIGVGWNSATAFEVGQPIWYFYGYKTHGIDPATGDPIFVTAAGNDTASQFIQDKDRQNIGSAIPKMIFGGNINLSYKGVDLNVSFTGQSGNKVLMGWIRSDKLASNRVTWFYDNRWEKPGDTGKKTPAANGTSNTYYSDLLVFDGSFLRIQQIQLGYNLPASLLKKAKVSAMRVYVSLDNFFTFTKYPGMDPQPTIQNNDPRNIGIDRGTYPMAKDVMVGATITF